MKNFFSTFIRPYFAVSASICSIIGLFIVVMSDKNATIIALITLCLCMLIVLIGIILAFDKMLRQNYGKEYRSISSFYVYQTDDGVKSTFETFRLIQCKRMFLSQIQYKFKWSGSLMPKKSVDFNCLYKQYYHVVVDPLPGYIYRLRWVK